MVAPVQSRHECPQASSVPGSVSLRERIQVVQAVRVAARRRSDMNEEHIRDYAIPAADLAAEASTHVPADVINAGQW